MALAGLHVVCGRLATRFGATLMTYPDWSETLASAATTSRAAVDGNSILQITAGVDAYFAVGATPNASAASGEKDSARYYIPAGTTREVFCSTGDKLAWAPVP